jgi:predicted dehydrogenase
MTLPAVAIVGLGRVGATNPAVPASDGHPIQRNHLQAALGAGLRIGALIDPDRQSREAAFALWQAGGGPALGEAPLRCGDLSEVPAGTVQIVTVASPPDLHRRHVEAALALRPRVLLLEKPVAVTLLEAHLIARDVAAHEEQTACFVNFNRRADPGMAAWRLRWVGRTPRLVVMRYGKGLMNYASHLVDHVLAWFGAPDRVRALPPFPATGDTVRQRDDSPGFLLEYDSGLIVHVLGFEDIAFDMLEIDVWFADGLESVRNNAVEKHAFRCEPDLYYPDYVGLVADEAAYAASPIGGFTETYRTLADRITGSGPHSDGVELCTMVQAVHGLEILHAVLCSRAAAGRPVPADAFTTAAAFA